MLIGGVDPRTLPVEEVLVFPKGDQQLVFRATGLGSLEDFERLCPEPVPPMKLTKEGKVADTEDKDYVAAISGHQKLRSAYLIVNSLRPSEIEWDTVKLDAPATWANWDKDLKNAGLSQIECNRIQSLVWEANCLDEKKLQKARELFLQGTRVQ
jgi:hypothetical protein